MSDVVRNPIPHSGLFASPTLDQIADQIERLPQDQKALLHMVMQMTMNACHKLVEDKILRKEMFSV